ncbi:MAG TPA: hypothetical protein DCZ11_00225 [Gammaproteobacteria bacterium]|nr:hypothetical protein [Gammaproteobacteria bacterium]MCH76852.1 hypothetical protein [Gammaproteobacteria bacterium]
MPRKPGRPARQTTEKRIQARHRTPLGAARTKLNAQSRPGYFRRWANDTGGRLEEAVNGGYQFAGHEDAVGHPDVIPGNTDTGSRTSKVVGVGEKGAPTRAYLMEIPEHLYQEDQAAKEQAISRTEASIQHGNIDGNASDGRYIPAEGIRLR